MSEIEKKATITLNQNSVFKRAMVDLESRIDTLDQSLHDAQKTHKNSDERVELINQEVSCVSAQTRQIGEALDRIKKEQKEQLETIHTLFKDYNLSMKSIEEIRDSISVLTTHLDKSYRASGNWLVKNDFFTDPAVSSEDPVTFSDNGEHNSEPTLIPPLPHEEEEPLSNTTLDRGKEKKSLVYFVLFALLIIATLFAYYAFKSPSPDSTPEMITRSLERPPVIAREVENSAPVAASTKPVHTDLVSKSSQDETSLPLPKKRTLNQLSPPVKPAQSIASAHTAGIYTINVGSFKDKGRAQLLTDTLIAKGYNTVMIPSEQDGLHRERVGSFQSVKDARAYAKIIEKTEKLPTFISSIE
jgi:cell division septation protein DedD